MSNTTAAADSSAASSSGRTPRLLENLWNDSEAAKLEANPLDLLRYRSNRLGDDLRITNFGGGNTSSKFEMTDPLTGQPQRVMAVKGSGVIRSITNNGFASSHGQVDSLIPAIAARPMRTRWSASTRWRVWREPCRRLDRHAAARVSAVRPRRSPASRLGDRPGRQRERRAEDAGVQPQVRPDDHLGAVAAARVRARADAQARGRGHARV